MIPIGKLTILKLTLLPTQTKPDVGVGVGDTSNEVTLKFTSSQLNGVGAGSQLQSKYAEKSKVVQSIGGLGEIQPPSVKKFADISGHVDLQGEAPSSIHVPPSVSEKHH